jgi:hypothetical protein
MSFAEAAAEAVKQGFVDFRTKTVIAQKYALRFTKGRTKKASRVE